MKRKIVLLTFVVLLFLLKFDLEVSATSTSKIDSKTNNKSAFEKYEDSRKNILIFNVQKNDLANIKEFFPKNDKLITLSEEAYKITNDPISSQNTDLVINTYKKLYQEYIVADSNKEVLLDYLKNRQAFLEHMLKNTSSPGMTLAWLWSDIARSCLLAFQATEDERFLQLLMSGINLAFEYTDKEIGKYDQFRKVKMDGWGFALSDDSRWETEITLPGQITTPILKFAVLIENDPKLKIKYSKQLDPYVKRSLAILNQYIDEMIYDERTQIGYFKNIRTDEHEAINHTAAYVSAVSLAYSLTKEDRYKKVAIAFYNYLISVSKLEGDGTAYSWPYQILKEKSNIIPSFFWKESVTINSLVDIDNHVFSIPQIEKTRFANTFSKLVIRDFSTVNAYITQDKYFPFTGYNVTFSNMIGAERLVYWYPVVQFDPKIKQLIDRTVATRKDLFSFGWFNAPYDAVGYAYRMLSKKPI